MEDRFYSYISTRANWDCTQTIFLCVPQEYAGSAEKAGEFAEKSGWVRQAEENAAVLIAPLAEDGWDQVSRSWIPEFYDVHKNDFRAPSGISTPGRNGILWLWETMIYLAGYEEGADYAAEALVANPGFFAASALTNGSVHDLSAADELTSHWFVKRPKNYQLKNKDIPSAVWLIGNVSDETKEYFCRCAQTDAAETVYSDGHGFELRFNTAVPAQEVRLSSEEVPAAVIMESFFSHILRWKNSPDGALKHYLGKKDYAVSERFVHYSVLVNGEDYPYTVYLPEGMTKETVKDLPVVFSIHGRGEPTWVFAEKNGWHKLADETKEFLVVFPDSPYNIWQIARDKEAIRTILEQVAANYSVDLTRVYLSGFSNGAIFTCQQASTYPALFAAASPWNGPGMEDCRRMNIDQYVYHEDFKDSGYEMPFWIFVGDSDSKASAFREDELDIVLAANHCDRSSEEIWDKDNHYTAANGYSEGERFFTRVFRNAGGSVRVGLTVMKNMPHGAVWDESRAAWEFMKRFRRPSAGRTVEEI